MASGPRNSLALNAGATAAGSILSFLRLSGFGNGKNQIHTLDRDVGMEKVMSTHLELTAQHEYRSTSVMGGLESALGMADWQCDQNIYGVNAGILLKVDSSSLSRVPSSENRFPSLLLPH
jgi:hypothetical protein